MQKKSNLITYTKNVKSYLHIKKLQNEIYLNTLPEDYFLHKFIVTEWFPKTLKLVVQ